MTGVFLSVPRYDWCAPLSHPSSCTLLTHGPSQQSSKEEYKPCKWGAAARYYAFHTKTMLPMRKSVPRSSRQSDHTKTPWPPDHRKETQTAVVWSCLPFFRSGQTHLARHSERAKKDKADWWRGGKTTSGNGQAWSSSSPGGQWRTTSHASF